MGRKEEKPYGLYDRKEEKPFAKGVAYGLYDTGKAPTKAFTKGVSYSLFDKKVMIESKAPLKKGTYGSYDKRSENVSLGLQAKLGVSSDSDNLDKGTYFTFGRMKEHLFFRVEKPTSRTR